MDLPAQLPESTPFFVDDDPGLVAAALELGYQGRWMRREDAAAPDDPAAAVPAIASLADLVDLVELVHPV
jgi:putative hydrolase of the HAD superfamily